MRNAPDKNPFRGVSDLLSRAAPAKRNLHFLSYLIDIILVAIVSYLLFLGGRAIVINSDEYKNNSATYESEITYYQDMITDAHLAVYLNRDQYLLADDEDLSIKMAISQILLSYSHDNPTTPDFSENPLDKLKEIYVGSFYEDCFVEASFANDYISRFFIEYVPAHNENEELVHFDGVEPSAYTIAFYKRHVSKYEKIKFIYTVDDSALPYLRTDVANEIYKYLVKADGYNRDCYDGFVEFYTAMLTSGENIVFSAKSYQSSHYQTYLSSRQKITQLTNIVLLISIFVAHYIAIFLPQMIFKDGRSIGKILLRLGTINVDKSEMELWKKILRSFLAAISNIYIAFFLVLLPPFNGASLVLYLPFITIGSFDITLFNIIIVLFLLSSINGIVMLLSHDKRSITDFIFKTITVDVTVLDEPDYDERDEASI